MTMQLADLHSFFLYVIFGHLLAYPAVALYLKYFPLHNPGQRMALYLLALLAPFIAFVLYHSLLTKQCHTGFFSVGGATLGLLCHVGYLAYSYLSPLLLLFIGAGISKAVAVPLFVARTRRQAVKLSQHEEERIKRILNGQCAALSLPVPEVIYSSHKGFSAFIAGLRKPVLVINAWLFSQLTEQEMKAVLTHELVHIRRKDTLFSYLLHILRDAVFFSPFSSSLLRCCLLENERRCDREAAFYLGDFGGYSAALLKVWKLLLEGGVKNPVLVSSFAGGRGREMELRLTSLLQAQQGKGSGRPSYLFFSFAAAMLVGTILLLGLIC
ncbi:MAG: M56 family metallopeptidase [Bacillota bacterium]